MTYGKHERDVSRAKWKQRFATFMPFRDDGWVEEIISLEAKCDAQAQVIAALTGNLDFVLEGLTDRVDAIDDSSAELLAAVDDLRAIMREIDGR